MKRSGMVIYTMSKTKGNMHDGRTKKQAVVIDRNQNTNTGSDD